MFIKFVDQLDTKIDVAIFIKSSSANSIQLSSYYVNPLVQQGFKRERIIAVELPYNQNGKISIRGIKDALDVIMPQLINLGVDYILCADAAYYKVLANMAKAETNLDKAVIGKYSPDINIVYTLNYTSLIYNPNQQDKIDMSINTLVSHKNGINTRIRIPYTDRKFPFTDAEIQRDLNDLMQYDKLAIDIETFGLRLGSGIASIAFSPDTTSGVSFLVDYKAGISGSTFGVRRDNPKVRSMLKHFLCNYRGELIYHRSAFDVKHIIWELFMEHPLDHKGMLEGVRVMSANFADTLFMAFLCLNSTTRPVLGLKPLAYEYTGDYAQEDIKDVTKIEANQLLIYNLDDTMATMWVYNKYKPLMALEDQVSVYWEFIKMQIVLFRTELYGMPMNDQRLNEVDLLLQNKRKKLNEVIINSKYVIAAEVFIINQKVKADNKKLKTKVRTFDDYDDFVFNPGSNDQLRVLLFTMLNLPVLKTTPTHEPKTDAEVLGMLINHTQDVDVKGLLQAIIDYSEVCTVLSTFIKAFKEGMLKADGRRYLHGNFNLAKVKSGRLSSSEPNLQNLPAGSTYGKMIKSIFQAPEGYLFVYSDFASLEDVISALLSKDPNKLRVYLGHDVYSVTADGQTFTDVRDDSKISVGNIEYTVTDLAKDHCTNFDLKPKKDSALGDLFKSDIKLNSLQGLSITKTSRTPKYDGHCLRAFSYFKEQLPNIVETPNSINSIKDSNPELRQESKAPTFMMTYMGSQKGLEMQYGFSPEKAARLYGNFHTLYSHTDVYINSRLDQAANLGYATLAFGLKLRCPLLAQTIRKSKHSALGTSGDERTLGNAMGQSYGMLNNRAMIEFMSNVDKEGYDLDIFPIAPIHDASYYIVKDDIDVVHFTNKHLISAMQWQEDPAIMHDEVKIGGELDVCYKSWLMPITVPNNATKEEIFNCIDKGVLSIEEDILKGKYSDE